MKRKTEILLSLGVFVAVLLGLFLPTLISAIQDSGALSQEETYVLSWQETASNSGPSTLDLLRLIRRADTSDLPEISPAGLESSSLQVCDIAKALVSSLEGEPDWNMVVAAPRLLSSDEAFDLRVWDVKLTWNTANYGSFLVDDRTGLILRFTLSRSTVNTTQDLEALEAFLQTHYGLQRCAREDDTWLRFTEETGESDLFSLILREKSVLFNQKIPN